MCRMLLLIELLVTASVGCGNHGRVATYPVCGRVMVDGEPAADAIVLLHVSDNGGASIPRGLRSAATTDDEGRFEIATYASGDGAPAGSYRVTVVWRGQLGLSADSDQVHPDELLRAPNRLPERFADPATTPLRAIISADTNRLDPFEISTR